MPDWMPIDDPQAVPRAAAVIEAGGLVILPTDTVYGVAADLWQPDAVQALYDAKRRPPDRAIPILLADPEHIETVAQSVPDAARRLADAFWPGPLTIVVPKRPNVPQIVSSLPTIGVGGPPPPRAPAGVPRRRKYLSKVDCDSPHLLRNWRRPSFFLTLPVDLHWKW